MAFYVISQCLFLMPSSLHSLGKWGLLKYILSSCGGHIGLHFKDVNSSRQPMCCFVDELYEWIVYLDELLVDVTKSLWRYCLQDVEAYHEGCRSYCLEEIDMIPLTQRL